MTKPAIKPGIEKQIRKVFKRDLMKISDFCQREGIQVMASSPDPNMESYYTTPVTRKMSKANFETGGATDAEDLETNLRSLWAVDPCPHFTVLATHVAKIAQSLRAIEGQSSELSQFVYVMY